MTACVFGFLCAFSLFAPLASATGYHSALGQVECRYRKGLQPYGPLQYVLRVRAKPNRVIPDCLMLCEMVDGCDFLRVDPTGKCNIGSTSSNLDDSKAVNDEQVGSVYYFNVSCESTLASHEAVSALPTVAQSATWPIEASGSTEATTGTFSAAGPMPATSTISPRTTAFPETATSPLPTEETMTSTKKPKVALANIKMNLSAFFGQATKTALQSTASTVEIMPPLLSTYASSHTSPTTPEPPEASPESLPTPSWAPGTRIPEPETLHVRVTAARTLLTVLPPLKTSSSETGARTIEKTGFLSTFTLPHVYSTSTPYSNNATLIVLEVESTPIKETAAFASGPILNTVSEATGAVPRFTVEGTGSPESLFAIWPGLAASTSHYPSSPTPSPEAIQSLALSSTPREETFMPPFQITESFASSLAPETPEIPTLSVFPPGPASVLLRTCIVCTNEEVPTAQALQQEDTENVLFSNISLLECQARSFYAYGLGSSQSYTLLAYLAPKQPGHDSKCLIYLRGGQTARNGLRSRNTLAKELKEDQDSYYMKFYKGIYCHEQNSAAYGPS